MLNVFQTLVLTIHNVQEVIIVLVQIYLGRETKITMTQPMDATRKHANQTQAITERVLKKKKHL